MQEGTLTGDSCFECDDRVPFHVAELLFLFLHSKEPLNTNVGLWSIERTTATKPTACYFFFKMYILVNKWTCNQWRGTSLSEVLKKVKNILPINSSKFHQISKKMCFEKPPKFPQWSRFAKSLATWTAHSSIEINIILYLESIRESISTSNEFEKPKHIQW
jgi:hypothetical protein